MDMSWGKLFVQYFATFLDFNELYTFFNEIPFQKLNVFDEVRAKRESSQFHSKVGKCAVFDFGPLKSRGNSSKIDSILASLEPRQKRE